MSEGMLGMESTLVWQWFADLSDIQRYKFHPGEVVTPGDKQSSTRIDPRNMIPYIERAMFRLASRAAPLPYTTSPP